MLAVKHISVMSIVKTTKQLLTIFFIINLFCLGLRSCTKPFNLNLSNQAPRMVVEGSVFSTPGPYFFRLTLSRTALSSSGMTDPIPIRDAVVTISDDFGVKDTLVAPPDSIIGYSKFYDRVGNNLVLDSVFVRGINSYTIKDGYYQTTRIAGVPGRTYRLVILYQGKEYTAEETMLIPTMLDSVGFGIKYSLKDSRPYKVGRLYFAEPQPDVNYYLAPTNGFSSIDEDVPLYVPIFSLRECFQAMLFDDKLLSNYVNGIFVDETCGKEQNPSDKVLDWGNGYLMTITKEYHAYIKTLFDQLKSDGGTYKPTPANPPTNISNGALGYFGAVAVSRKFYFFK